MARLPAAERDAFKEPMGTVYDTAETLLADVSEPIIAVGDVVLAHLGRAGCTPAVSVVDDRTERGPVPEWVLEDRPQADVELSVENPPGTITAELVTAIETGLDQPDATMIRVSGEEDLSVLPVLMLAPEGATVVYGQPGEGMVAVPVDGDHREKGRSLLDRMDRDPAFWESIG